MSILDNAQLQLYFRQHTVIVLKSMKSIRQQNDIN